jgi:hypothetical protein
MKLEWEVENEEGDEIDFYPAFPFPVAGFCSFFLAVNTGNTRPAGSMSPDSGWLSMTAFR